MGLAISTTVVRATVVIKEQTAVKGFVLSATPGMIWRMRLILLMPVQNVLIEAYAIVGQDSVRAWRASEDLHANV